MAGQLPGDPKIAGQMLVSFEIKLHVLSENGREVSLSLSRRGCTVRRQRGGGASGEGLFSHIASGGCRHGISVGVDKCLARQGNFLAHLDHFEVQPQLRELHLQGLNPKP